MWTRLTGLCSSLMTSTFLAESQALSRVHNMIWVHTCQRQDLRRSHQQESPFERLNVLTWYWHFTRFLQLTGEWQQLVLVFICAQIEANIIGVRRAMVSLRSCLIIITTLQAVRCYINLMVGPSSLSYVTDLSNVTTYLILLSLAYQAILVSLLGL